VRDNETANTFLFADLAGFTALTEAMGDEEAADLVGAFCSGASDLLPQYEAEQIKAIGDAMMIRADHPAQGVRLGLRIVNDIGGRHFFPTVRVGMDTGHAVERDGDWFGATVNTAARISGVAAGGEVLLSEATRDAAGTIDGVALRERGRRSLRNIGEPVVLYEAAQEGESDKEGLPIDPVCRMSVDPRYSAGKLSHEGVEYHFCSLGCAGEFAAAPDRYGNRGS
jgi:class 3 adenylate cyclase/YHS domain-containing protein